MVHNPSVEIRMPLVIKELNEEFNVIDEIVVQENIPKEEKTYSLELSYPYLVKHKNDLHLTYTYGRSRIEYCVIKI